VSPRSPFIVPSAPVLKTVPPRGDGWLHELKFDGWRAQLHKDRKTATIYSRNGKDLTERFPTIRDAVLALPLRAIIDAELVASDDAGQPNFHALMARASKTANVCAWCFDLLSLNGRDFRSSSLVKRRIFLHALIVDNDTLRYSNDFTDAEKLFAAAESMGFEGIVSKRDDQPYRSGKNPGWIKVKSKAWRAAHRGRSQLFQKR
jgi:bifunctional non-homologous end joining protein LigD